ncbi:MAG: S8 family serine peptidase [Verrucomicrobia bacterium]|nr:S8 family serine peptidase [Verrucomicrobiota bacterium]
MFNVPLRSLIAFAFAAALAGQAFAAPPPPVSAPANLGLGLRQMVESYQRDKAQLRSTASSHRAVQMDAADRVVVNIHLDGAVGAAAVAQQVKQAGGDVLAIDEHWRKGVISARLPLDQIETAASWPGVRSILLAPRPVHHIGKVTAESSWTEHAIDANTAGVLSPNGFLGRGISVGILSDSFNTAQGVPRAAAGVAAGDLPGTGNPNGFTQPVVLLDDNFDPNADTTDEGRGMAEIVHDIAPAAKICFHTSGSTQAIMALGIRKLRADPAALCDVIVDDVLFLDEPFFSDGELSQAVDDVATSTVLPGKDVAYFAAAGNSANFGYSADLRQLTAVQGIAANAAAARPVNLTQVPPALYAGGFHNLNGLGAPAIAMPITTDANIPPEIVFQWDDPFDTGHVTTDYNLLVFDQNGNYRGDLSGTDNNRSTDEPVEFVFLDANTTYYLVISLASPTPVARHLRFISVDDASLAGPYIGLSAPTMAGHATARHASAVAAYNYNFTRDALLSYNAGHANPPPGPYRPALESFTSNGGALAFYFDANGNRLATPDVRFKPNVAACDGVDTSFFPEYGSDPDNDGYPNFFGTSAAAPTAAAIAALVLEAKGGPQSIAPDPLQAKLESTAQPHNLVPFVSQAVAGTGSATVNVTAHGNDSNTSETSPGFFTVTFNGAAGDRLNSLIIDLTNTWLAFDPATFPFTIGANPNGVTVSSSLSPDARTLTLDFGGTFAPGDSLLFGIARGFAATQAGGYSADFLAGGEIRAQINSTPVLGAFTRQLGAGWTFVDGYGLVDARNAISASVSIPTLASSVPTNLSTRGDVGAGDNVLIGGFSAAGSGYKAVILRALGPTLARYGVTAALPDPTLTLYNANGAPIAYDDNWQDSPSQAAQIASRHFAPPDPRESAIYLGVTPGSYTAIVRGKSGSGGIGLVEVYDLDAQPAPAQLTSISTRGNVGTGEDVVIAGFHLTGNNAANIVVRGIGPSLAAFGVPNVLADPVLTLHNAQGTTIAANDNWQQDSLQATQIQQVGLAPANGLESAITLALAPGSYTAVLSGGNNTTGNALVQVYRAP